MQKILIVDDEQEMRELVKKKLEKNGYEVMDTADGQEALSFCKNAHPEVVLLDIALPGMDGYQIAEKIKQDPESRNINILFLTGKDLDPAGIIKRCDKVNAYGYISKPFAFEDLLAKIKEILGK